MALTTPAQKPRGWASKMRNRTSQVYLTKSTVVDYRQLRQVWDALMPALIDKLTPLGSCWFMQRHDISIASAF
jgi:hypothetical protein